MSHTHFLFHIVFGTKDRMPLIAETWEKELYKYIGGIIRNNGGIPIEMNGMPDHGHILTRLSLKHTFPDFMRDLKASSSRWIRRNHQSKFSWQRRYGAFTVSESACEAVRKYIKNQKIHHTSLSFEDEYKELLRLHKIEFNEQYLWD